MKDYCANCGEEFMKKAQLKGYYRHSLENNLPNSETSAREFLSSLTNVTFVAVDKKRSGRFLCPACWSSLSDSMKYSKATDTFWGRSKKQTYISARIEQESSAMPSTSGEQSTFPVKEKPQTTSTLGIRRKKLAKTKGGVRSSDWDPNWNPNSRYFANITNACRSTKWDPIINKIRNRKYSSAIRGLYNATPASKKRFNEVVAKIINRETVCLLKSNLPLFEESSLSNISSFTWNETLEKFASIAPLSSKILSAIATTPKGAKTLTRGRKNLKPMLGLALALLLHARAPRKADFIQTLFSVQLWRGGLKKETLKQLSRFGICHGIQGTVSAIDNMRKSFDAKGKQTKQNPPKQLSSGSSCMPTVNNDDLDLSTDINHTIPDDDVEENDLEEEFMEDDQEEEEDDDDEEEDEKEDDMDLEEDDDI